MQQLAVPAAPKKFLPPRGQLRSHRSFHLHGRAPARCCPTCRKCLWREEAFAEVAQVALSRTTRSDWASTQAGRYAWSFSIRSHPAVDLASAPFPMEIFAVVVAPQEYLLPQPQKRRRPDRRPQVFLLRADWGSGCEDQTDPPKTLSNA